MSARNKLPYIDLLNFKGLYTKSSPEVLTKEMLVVAENCDFFETYGATAKLPGSSRVIDTVYTESSVAQKIPWLGFYKASDLDGQILRQVLVAAGTKLFRLEGANLGTSTELESGRTPDIFHDSAQLGRTLLLTNYDPDLVGKGDQLIKYDGAVTTKWGLDAPGSQETIREDFDDASDWTASADCSVTDEATVTWDGDAININKTGTASATFNITKTLDTAFSPRGLGDNVTDGIRDVVDGIENRVNFRMYIPRGTLVEKFKLDGPCLSVYAGADGNLTTNYWRFDFTVGELLEGWNQISLDFTSGAPATPTTTSNPILGAEDGTFDPDSDNVTTVRFEWILQDVSTTISGIRLDQLVQLDEGSPVVNAGGSGSASFTGVYQYKIAFVSKYGNISNAGAASVSLTTAADPSIVLTNIPTSDDSQIIERRIYRTVAGGSIFAFVDQIFDNDTTTYTDETADGSLGLEQPPQAANFNDDNSPPPRAGIVTVWKRTVFMAGDPQNPDTLYFSDDDEPESFPLVNTFDLDEKITAIYETYSGLCVETENSKWQVVGDNPDFAIDKLVSGMGCVGRRAQGTSRIEGYSMDRDGFRLYNLTNASKISEPIRDKFDDFNRVNIELTHTIHSKNRNIIALFVPDSNAEYTTILAYIYPVDDVTVGYWTNIVTPTAANLNFLHAVEIEDSNGDFHIYTGGDDGMIYEIFDSDSKNWVDASGTTYAMDTNFTTPYMRLGELGAEIEGSTEQIDPQFIEVRATGDAATWNLTINMAEGIDQTTPSDTKTINMEFAAGETLKRYPVHIGTPLTKDLYVQIAAQNNEEDVFSRLLAIRLYFHVDPSKGAIT